MLGRDVRSGLLSGPVAEAEPEIVGGGECQVTCVVFDECVCLNWAGEKTGRMD